MSPLLVSGVSWTQTPTARTHIRLFVDLGIAIPVGQ
jgi:hypothetical protein